MKKQLIIAGAFFFFSFLFALPLLRKPMVAEADAFARLKHVKNLTQDGKFFVHQHPVWLPLHYTVMVIAMAFFDDIYTTPRIATWLFSFGSLVVMYYLTQELFRAHPRKELLGMTTSILFLLLPLRIFLATQILSETVFLFFMLLFLYLFLKSPPKLLLSILFLNIAHGIRYESWLLLPLIWLMISNARTTAFKKVYLLATSTVVPLYWIIQSYRHSGTLFAFFKNKVAIAREVALPHFGNLGLSLTAWWQPLLETYPLLFLILYVAGLYVLIRKRIYTSISQLVVAFIPVYLFQLLVLQVFAESMEWFPQRYLLTTIVLTIPYTALGLYELLVAERKSVFYSFFMAVTAITFFFSYTHSYIETAAKTHRYYLDSKIESGFADAANWYLQLPNSDQQTILYLKDWESHQPYGFQEWFYLHAKNSKEQQIDYTQLSEVSLTEYTTIVEERAQTFQFTDSQYSLEYENPVFRVYVRNDVQDALPPTK